MSARHASPPVCLALALFAAACIDGTEGDELDLDQLDEAIEIGTSDHSTLERNAVVLVGGFCTGTLVAPNVVLTAAHCGWARNELADGAWHTIPPVTIYFGPSRTAPVATATATAVSVPPLATAGPWPIDDMALLRLSTSVASTVALPRPMYLDRPATLSASSTLYQVGYGGGRDRRFMTGTSYRDWDSADHLMNGFAYTPTSAGAGIGDRNTNIEGGDSGGPMLLGSPTGFVLGELSHWEPYGIATFGPGGEGRPSVRNWLAFKAPQKPDFAPISIVAAGCTGTGGQPTVRVRVRNAGARRASTRVDVFHGRTYAPVVGDISSLNRMSPYLAPEGATDMSFAIPAAAGWRRIDVVLDTTRSSTEIDEINNRHTQYVNLPDCSFN